MAKVQSRRSVSLNSDLWKLVASAAKTRRELMSQYVALAIRQRLSRDGKKPRRQWFAGPPRDPRGVR